MAKDRRGKALDVALRTIQKRFGEGAVMKLGDATHLASPLNASEKSPKWKTGSFAQLFDAKIRSSIALSVHSLSTAVVLWAGRSERPFVLSMHIDDL